MLIELESGGFLNPDLVSMWDVRRDDEPEEWDDDEADEEPWAVRGRLPCGSSVWVARFPTEPEARAFLAELMEKVVDGWVAEGEGGPPLRLVMPVRKKGR